MVKSCPASMYGLKYNKKPDEKSDAVRQQLMKDLKFPSHGRQDRVTALKSSEEMFAY